MNYRLLLILLLPYLSKAQLHVTGLGRYTIGVTTPDSLKSADFEEQAQSYVKGTIALPCTHIRTFKSPRINVAGVMVSNLCLDFYDNKLYKLSCDSSDDLTPAFRATYGKGGLKLMRYVSFCTTNQRMTIEGEVWQNDDTVAYVVHAKGYDRNCQSVDILKVSIYSQRLKALSSDCEVNTTNPYEDKFENVLDDYQQKPSTGAPVKE